MRTVVVALQSAAMRPSNILSAHPGRQRSSKRIVEPEIGQAAIIARFHPE
jgi:hypothetical protein